MGSEPPKFYEIGGFKPLLKNILKNQVEKCVMCRYLAIIPQRNIHQIVTNFKRWEISSTACKFDLEINHKAYTSVALYTTAKY